jgi:FMN phosphatase YigB (HAD superfamily)
MLGDNPVADIEGAANVGMHAVLVRHADAADTDLLSSARSLLR